MINCTLKSGYLSSLTGKNVEACESAFNEEHCVSKN